MQKLPSFYSLSSKTASNEMENGNKKAQKICEDLQEFDEKLKSHRPALDKTLVGRSYFISTLRVSWNLIEAEILHNPGECCFFSDDTFSGFSKAKCLVFTH